MMRKLWIAVVLTLSVLMLAASPLRAGEPVVIQETTKAAEMSVTIPAALADIPALTAKLSMAAGRRIDDFAGRAKEAYDQSRRQDQWRKWTMEIEHELTFANPRIVSILRRTWVYSGGAHGNVGLDSVIYDRDADKTLGLDGLFGPTEDDAPVLQTMARYAENIFLETLAQASDPDWIRTGTAPKLANYDALTLVPATEPGKAGGIRVHFAPYTVAPYAAGPQQVTISQKRIFRFLRTNWRGVFAGDPAAD